MIIANKGDTPIEDVGLADLDGELADEEMFDEGRQDPI